MEKPIRRSKIRIFFGKTLFKILRYYNWYFGKKSFSKVRSSKKLPFIVKAHKTPLIRNLKNVEMWMQYNKIVNLQLATAKLNGIIIKPGETFSYWKLIGKATKRKGYKKGMVFQNRKLVAGYGGGLCQLSNHIYWLALHTDLEVIERYRHSYDVFPDSNRTQPFGSGATCIYNYRDLQIFNGTDQEYQLNLQLDDEFLIGEFRTDEEQITRYEICEKNHIIEQEFWGGYVRKNEIFKRMYDLNGNAIGEEFVTENEAIMLYQPYLRD